MPTSRMSTVRVPDPSARKRPGAKVIHLQGKFPACMSNQSVTLDKEAANLSTIVNIDRVARPERSLHTAKTVKIGTIEIESPHGVARARGVGAQNTPSDLRSAKDCSSGLALDHQQAPPLAGEAGPQAKVRPAQGGGLRRIPRISTASRLGPRAVPSVLQAVKGIHRVRLRQLGRARATPHREAL